MSKSRGIVFEAEVSRDVQPGVVTLYDMSRYQNNGTITAGAGGYVQLPSGLWVYEFDGLASLIDCGNNPSVNLGTSDFTLLTWFKGSDKTAYNGLINKGTTGAGGLRFQLLIDITTGFFAAYIDDNTVTPTFKSAIDVSDNVWRLGAAVFDRDGNGQIYLNGAVSGAAVDISAADASISSVANLYIGVDISGSSNFLNGSMGLSRIYNHTLTAGQILKHFEAERSLFGV